jgi:hypothetical protein
MFWVTEDAKMVCSHESGIVTDFDPSQSWVTIGGRRVLIQPDPVNRSIAGCPNLPPVGKQCLKTIGVFQGYSALIRIGGFPVCMDNLKGPVDAPSPPYQVRNPAQELVGTDT